MFDYDKKSFKFLAERQDEHLSLDLQLETEAIEDPSELHQRAEDIVVQLTVTEAGLEMKRANECVIKD